MKTLLSCVMAACAISCFGWGQKGHDVTAYIAEQHLTPATRQAIDSIFEGKSIVYWSNWLDNASHTPDYEYTKTWHYKNIDQGIPYDKAPIHEKGNIETALHSQIEALKDPTLSKEEQALALKIVVHLMGDLHQPMHIGRATDLGGNKVKVKFFKDNANLHGVWDTNILESGHKWSYTEWQQQIDRLSPDVENIVIMGTIPQWGNQTYEIAQNIYETTPDGALISYDYIAAWTPVIETQLLKGGLRLAHVLNTIFDPYYGGPKTPF